MTELAGQVGQSDGAAMPDAILMQSQVERKPMGAERFRALTERLKTKPAPHAIPPPASPAIQAAPAAPAPALVVQETVPAPPVSAAPAARPAEASPSAPQVLPPPVGAPTNTVFGSTPFAKSETPQPVTIDPMQRRLSGLFTATSAQPSYAALQLPEILPPPPPPPPPVSVNDLSPGAVPPSMEEVQQRLKEDATARLEQLDLENTWRQVLSMPTIEERAQYLREAAEYAALQEIAVDTQVALAPENDLSRIAPPEEIAAEEAAPVTLPPGKLLDPELPALNAEEAETAEVARSLLDMMSSGNSSGLPQERALAADTLLRLVPKLALKPLIMLAERLSIMENPPHLIVGKLIRDPRPEVSGPLLENCMHVSEADLITVALEENPGKRRMLARRRKLTAPVSKALIATQDPSVVLTLVRNANAEISHEGFAALIECAGDMPDILAPLSTRGDLSAPFAFELFWKSPPQLRRYLLSRFLTDSETLTKILKITLSTQGEENAAQGLSTGELIETLGRACKGKLESAAEKIGDALNVSSECMLRVLADRSGEAIVVMLKVAGFPRGNTGDVLNALKRGEIPLLDEDRNISELQVMFDTLSSNKARILLTYWDWAVKKSGPYAPVH